MGTEEPAAAPANPLERKLRHAPVVGSGIDAALPSPPLPGSSPLSGPPALELKLTFSDRVSNLETEVNQQNAHILVCHKIIDQLTDQVNQLREQFGLEKWQPQLLLEDDPAT